MNFPRGQLFKKGSKILINLYNTFKIFQNQAWIVENIHAKTFIISYRHVSLFTTRIRRSLSLSLLSQSKPKNKKNKLLYQNRIRKILEDRNCIIYVIVEARGPKCIFFETYGTPLMVAAFSFWSPLFQSQLS
jgi:hypothetical protein